MFYNSPQLADDLLVRKALSRGGVFDPTSTVAAHAAQQARTLADVDYRGKQLGLASERLDEGSRQFNERLGLSKDIYGYGKRQGDIATGISALGLGVSALGDIAANNRFEQQMKIRDEMISDLEAEGSADSKFYAKLLQFLE